MKTRYKYVQVICIGLLLFISIASKGQITQTVKGTITDNDSNAPVIGANVIVEGSEPIIGASTDIEGYFKITNLPLGRINLVISSIGYEDMRLPNIILGSGKEVVLNITLKESIETLNEVVIKAKENKSDVLNEMTLVSARTFSVEETKRYAGTFNDPARMVANFAGIQSNAEGSNHIVVRGNSPNNVQWYMEGIEIPNPNHFAEEGSSGGAINVLNSAMLANSDFHTGAFTPEYGNVTAGVFDMRMRTGNNEKREYSFTASMLGTDITAEGPFKKGGNSSYLANYRYSTLAILDDMGVVDFGGVPKYQDLAFKLMFPTKEAGIFTVFGLGGRSSINDEYVDDDTQEILAKDDYSASLGTLNLSHVFFFNNNSSLESYIATSQNGSSYHYEEKDEMSGTFEPAYEEDLDKYSLRISTAINTKINAKNTFRSGLKYSHHFFTFSQQWRDNSGQMETWLDDSDNAGMFQTFATWKHRLNDRITFTGGLHYVNFMLNNSQSIEPRLSGRYEFAWNQSLFAGIGIHSQMASLPVYFTQINDEHGIVQRPNLDLGLMKARHYVIGYDNRLNPNLYFKTELYYQDLYDTPVENEVNSSYSLINAISGLSDRALVNQGTGSNYGVELTLERYFYNNFYYLLTASIFDSKYEAMDAVHRNSRFNGHYLTNFLIGKEFFLGDRTKHKVLALNMKMHWSGARRFTPINLDSSIDEGRTVRVEEQAFAERGDDLIKLDFSIAYSWNKPRTRQELKLDIQNFTNNAAKVDEYYNSLTEEIEVSTQLPMFPVLMYTIQF